MCAPRPMLFIVGSNAGTKYFSEEAHAKLKDSSELYIYSFQFANTYSIASNKLSNFQDKSPIFRFK